MGKEMDLNFQLFETATLFITVLVVAFMMQVCDFLCAPYELVLTTFVDVSLHSKQLVGGS